MHQLGTLTARSAREIIPLHTRHLEASARRVEGGSRAGRSTADDQEIEDIVVLCVLVLVEDRAGFGPALGRAVDELAGRAQVLEHLRSGGRGP